MKIEQWDDIDCTIKYVVKDSYMDFEVFEVVARYENKKTGEYTEPKYLKKGASSSEDMTEDLDEAETLLKGSIKWDACSHVRFGDEVGYLHLCGGRSWFNLIEATKRVYKIAIKELSKEESKDMFDIELFNP